MRVVHIAPGPYFQVAGRLASELASVRLRAIEPGLALEQLGHGMRIVPYGALRPAMRSGALKVGDVFVLQKAMHDIEGVIDWLRARRRPVVVDVCDDVFRLPRHAEHYPDMIRAADAVTAATEAMAARVREETGREAAVVPDCLEGARGAAPFDPATDGRLRLLWFGRAANLAPLIDRLPALAPARIGMPVRLHVVCNRSAALERLRPAVPAGLELAFTPWSLPAVEAALADCHVVVLPSDDHPVRAVKSANRLERSLWGGRPVVASPAAVLEPYRDVAVLAGDLAAGLASTLGDWPATLRRTAAGQERVAVARSPAAVAREWLAALSAVTSDPRPEMPPRCRLLLAGDGRPLAGWTSALPAGTVLPAGVAPGDFDLVLDQGASLPVADASLDRLLVVGRASWSGGEWRRALADWLRALRPGGRLMVQWSSGALAAGPLTALLTGAGLRDVRAVPPSVLAGDPPQQRAAGEREGGCAAAPGGPGPVASARAPH